MNQLKLHRILQKFYNFIHIQKYNLISTIPDKVLRHSSVLFDLEAFNKTSKPRSWQIDLLLILFLFL